MKKTKFVLIVIVAVFIMTAFPIFAFATEGFSFGESPSPYDPVESTSTNTPIEYYDVEIVGNVKGFFPSEIIAHVYNAYNMECVTASLTSHYKYTYFAKLPAGQYTIPFVDVKGAYGERLVFEPVTFEVSESNHSVSFSVSCLTEEELSSIKEEEEKTSVVPTTEINNAEVETMPGNESENNTDVNVSVVETTNPENGEEDNFAKISTAFLIPIIIFIIAFFVGAIVVAVLLIKKKKEN